MSSREDVFRDQPFQQRLRVQVVQRRLRRGLPCQRAQVQRQQQFALDFRGAALAIAGEHHLHVRQRAIGDTAVQLRLQGTHGFRHAGQARRHRFPPRHLPAVLGRERGAACAEDEQRRIRRQPGGGGLQQALIEPADEPVLAGEQHDAAAFGGGGGGGVTGAGGQQPRGAHRGGHRFGVAADPRQRALRLLHAHAGERAHGADHVQQLAHAGDVALDFEKAGHGGRSGGASRQSAPCGRKGRFATQWAECSHLPAPSCKGSLRAPACEISSAGAAAYASRPARDALHGSRLQKRRQRRYPAKERGVPAGSAPNRCFPTRPSRAMLPPRIADRKRPMPQTDWRNRAGTTFACEKQPAIGRRGMVVTNHRARLRRRGRDAGRRRQRHRRRDRRLLHPDRGGADDGRHPGRRHGPYPPGRRHPRGAGRPEHGAARHRPHHLHARPGRRPRHHGRHRPQERARPHRRGHAGQPDGLVPGAGTPRPLLPGRRDGAGDPPRLPRLPRHALPARVRLRLRRRPGAGSGDRAALPARRHADPAGRAPGHRRLRRDPARHRPGRPHPALRRHARPALRRPHGAQRRPPDDGRPDPLPHHRPHRAARHLSRARDRRPAAALLRPAAHHPDAEHPGGLRHRRAWASAPPTRCTCWPRS